jgi:heavy metal translocating P-type ATPase
MKGHSLKLRTLAQFPSHTLVAIVILAGMAAAGVGAYMLGDPRLAQMVLLGAIVVTGLPLCVELVAQIAKGNLSVDILAILSVVSAIVLRQYWVAAIVILMLSGGKALEEFSTRRASTVLRALSRRMPQIAHRIESEDRQSDVSIEEVAVGDKLSIYPHELCPVDGVVLVGLGTMDESYLTGEPFLIAKAPGATVLSGSINGDSALTIEATSVASDSRYAKIVEVLHASEENRPRIRRLGERLGIWYTPTAIAIALLSWGLSGDPVRFLAVLVIATPCPLLLAIPVAIIGAVSVAARRGIVIKDPSILEKLGTCTTLIVDKTGTLTYGQPSLKEVVASGRWTRRSLIQWAASLEKYSKHPLSSAVLKAAEEEGIPLISPRTVSEAPGHGLAGDLDGLSILLTGRGRIQESMQHQLAEVQPGLECVVLVNGQLGGVMRFHDQPRRESKPFLSHVESHHGIEQIVLLSGDRQAEVSLFAQGMGISNVHGGKSPEEKVAIVRDLTRKQKTLYLGDGINDAPAMMNATVGVALGVNSDITAEAAGAVILQSSLASVDELIHIGTRMRRIAVTSAVGGMLLSMIGMGAGALGLLAPIEGAILQEFIDLLSILNSLRMILPVKTIGDFAMPAMVHPPAPVTSSSPASLRP